MPIATHIIQMIIIIERTQHFNNILFLAAISSSLFHATHAQRAAQLVAPRAIPDTSNQSLGILLVVLVIAFLVTGLCSFYLRQCSETYVLSGTTTIGPKGLDPEVLATFPIMLYSAVKTGQNVALQCAVCLSEFNDLDKLRLLPKCSHVFHPDCIDAWLASHVTCPVCRAKLKPDCGEIAVEIEHENIARQVFDESSVRRGEVVGGGNEGGGSGNIDGRVGKDNGSSNMRTFGVLVRSHSTGHSLVEPGKNMERFTLRLSEEVRKHILDDKRGGSLTMKRSASYDVVLESGEGCSGKGWWGRSEGGEGSSKGKNKWMLSMTPPFVSRGLNASTTCSGIPRFWTSSIVREDKESEGEGRTIDKESEGEGRTIFQVL